MKFIVQLHFILIYPNINYFEFDLILIKIHFIKLILLSSKANIDLVHV